MDFFVPKKNWRDVKNRAIFFLIFLNLSCSGVAPGKIVNRSSGETLAGQSVSLDKIRAYQKFDNTFCVEEAAVATASGVPRINREMDYWVCVTGQQRRFPYWQIHKIFLLNKEFFEKLALMDWEH